jgi:hypothetical protein
LAALIPIVARLWRSAAGRGEHKTFLLRCASFSSLTFLALFQVGYFAAWPKGILLTAAGIYTALAIITFSIETGAPLDRKQVTGFAMSMLSAVLMLVIVYVEARLDVKLPQVTQLASPSPTPTPFSN